MLHANKKQKLNLLRRALKLLKKPPKLNATTKTENFNQPLWYPVKQNTLPAYQATRHVGKIDPKERIEQFNQQQRKYDQAMQNLSKLIADDQKPGQQHQAIVPYRLSSISQALMEGTLAYITAAYQLAEDYPIYCHDKNFLKEYKNRMEYIDVMKEELSAAMDDLKKSLGHLSLYRIGLEAGENKIQGLLIRLNLAKEKMQRTHIGMDKTEKRASPL